MLSEFVQSVKDAASETMSGIHTALPGEIVAVDFNTGTATVIPRMKLRTPSGQRIDFPQISGVPICIPQGAGQSATIAFPVNPGDGCLIIIAEQSLDLFMYNRDTETTLPFDLTNAICIPGLFPIVSPMLAQACASGSVIVCAGGGTLSVGSGGVSITGSLTVSGDVTAGGVSLKSHTHTAPADGGTTSGPS